MIVVKILGGLAVSTLTATFGVLTLKPDLLGIPPNITIYMSSSAVDNNSLDTSENFNKGVQCRFAAQPNTVFDCDVFVSKNTLNQTKQYKLNNMSNVFEKAKHPTNNNTDKLIMINFNFKDWKDSYESQTIEVISKNNPTNGNKKFFNLKTLAAVHQHKTTQYFIAKAPNIEQTFNLPANPQKCSFEDNKNEACTIIEFSDEVITSKDQTYSDLKFKKPDSTPTGAKSVEKNKYYLIKTDKAQRIHGFSYQQLTTNDSNSKTIKFTNIKPAIYKSDNEYIFIVN